MKRLDLVLIKLFFIPVLFSQPGFVNFPPKGINPADREVSQIQNRLVLPTLGRATKNNTFYIEPGNCLFVTDSTILIVNNKTEKTVKKLGLKHSGQKSYNASDKTENNPSPAKKKQDGWITHAECWYYGSKPKPTYFSAEWIIPSLPLRKSDQLIYLFVGLGDTYILPDSNAISYILQPVLQWGISPAGGGKYWSMCNWFVTSEGQYFHDSLIKVNPGDRLQGVVKCLASTDSTYSYNSSFTGYGAGLDVHDIKGLGTGYLALETYGVRNCIDNPADEKLRMFNIQMMIDGGYPQLFWQTYNDIDHCGEFTNIIHESSRNGEINIHFHKPYSEDNFEDIYLYPNPVLDVLHVSITDPIIRCRIEIYNGLGILVLTDTPEELEYEYDINFKNYPPGIYYAKFYYQKDKYTQETSHTFKFIKTKK